MALTIYHAGMDIKKGDAVVCWHDGMVYPLITFRPIDKEKLTDSEIKEKAASELYEFLTGEHDA